ncbi:hypothetical protein FHS15_001748 [Paenibacillus castaneae]|nr:hypothetical protein [Paenibacillus castaneae]
MSRTLGVRSRNKALPQGAFCTELDRKTSVNLTISNL